MHASFQSDLPLEADDLHLLQRFLEAWCAENGADIRSEEANQVAVGLISWYQSGVSDRTQLRHMFMNDHALPERIDALLKELAFL
ncbi:hypothetical protein QO002_004795 [Pararhizobium capsulatum DSM 1112]|uniref:Uncharacterized protein n=1 Tax=Pararhizobium capsulatum DSM 1112 TaxID=1121113 RepID=A0ABU0BWG2_9HYPH|nr:hypothetical protein [Pararhizobium capsulatum]MDQ0322589.1 hypothetical protein [Pararhizobium capsulatum DSM 1112]